MNESIKIEWHKCFPSDCEPQWFNEIKPINIVIWKNNSWKSSLLDLIKFRCWAASLIPNWTSIVIESEIQESDIIWIGDSVSGWNIPWTSHNSYIRWFIWQKLKYKLRNWSPLIIWPDFISYAGQYFQTILSRKEELSVFHNRILRNVYAERDIEPEDSGIWDAANNLSWNWKYATQLLRQLFSETSIGWISNARELNNLKTDFFDNLNLIIKPDIDFIDITIKQITWSNKWEIYFETIEHNFFPLSKMWSWMKTIILVLINLVILPKIHNRNISDYVFILEELENNLHPAMQRRLYDFIIKYSEENTWVIFFISTHSNIVIDIFSKYTNSQILHISNNNGISEVKTILNKSGQKQILEELDYRASDLLQTNWVIWVEWPSDRVYINKWLQLKFPELKEWIHYSIMFYWWRLLSHLSFKNADDSEVNNFIEILKINRNAFVMIDRDGKRAWANINSTKLRILTELWTNTCWITDWIEIENYLNWWILYKWLNWNHRYIWSSLNIDKFDKIDSIIPSSVRIKYSDSKVKYSQEIIEFIELTDINSDPKLKNNIEQLWLLIKKWNKLS